MGQAFCVCSRSVIVVQEKRYLLIDKLGEGGFSYVDLVEGLHDGHFYALKRIICHDKESKHVALSEAHAHQLFQHPNVLPLVGTREMDKAATCEVWLLLPYHQKGTLWDELERLRDKGSVMEEEHISQILHGICSGLKAIHDRGYAHRYVVLYKLPVWVRISTKLQTLCSEASMCPPSLGNT
uniref:non-specific serine/threonine protein kinase n=1 Tax=Eptatretus burgeri TaxID=7764 RepID=A0A8C4WTE2_EPTBU